MTDIGYLVALGIALFLAVDPFEWRLERITLTKHFPLILVLPFVLLTFVASRMFKPHGEFPKVLLSFRPLFALSMLVTAGSLYARFHSGIQNTFLFAGVYMLAAPMAAYMLVRSSEPVRLLRAYLGLLLVAGAVVFLGLATNYGVRQVYHELEYLVPPIAIFFAFWPGPSRLRWSGMAFFLLAAILFKKNTGYLTALLILTYLIWFKVIPEWRAQDGIRRMVKLYGVFIALLLTVALGALILQYREAYLPSGNVEFRTLTYERAWSRFKESPGWGTLFTGAATEQFTGFDTGVARNILPTHSDILDLLANGGLLGIALWLWALARVARLAFFASLRPSQQVHELAPYAHMLACMSLAGVLTYAFNPIFLQSAKSLLLWTHLGFLAGISLLLRTNLAMSSAPNS
jgi:hypothetical protein